MTKFRGCIDLHQGKVKQIIGGSLKNDSATTNFVSTHNARFYANLYKQNKVTGSHVIKLGPGCDEEAAAALNEWHNSMQIGGGINLDNCEEWISNGASHVILTSYLFPNGNFNEDNLRLVSEKVGTDRLVVDLSCRKTFDNQWKVAMDKWQKLTDTILDEPTFQMMSNYCSEFLVHAADVEGLCNGIDQDLVTSLGKWSKISCTYAGGARNLDDLALVQSLSNDGVDLTLGSALDIFGGSGVKFHDAVVWNNQNQ